MPTYNVPTHIFSACDRKLTYFSFWPNYVIVMMASTRDHKVRFQCSQFSMQSFKRFWIIRSSGFGQNLIKIEVQFFHFNWEITCNGSCVNLMKPDALLKA